jgi:Uma2 family endonuclease
LELFGSDQKVYLPKLNVYLYPDAIVVTQTPIMAENIAQAIVNPLLVVEVLSPSTEDYDRKDKFMKYRTLESFKEYVIIQQNSAEILN